ncbi:44853_t:CDS:1, partial [Gigaspora margarita]
VKDIETSPLVLVPTFKKEKQSLKLPLQDEQSCLEKIIEKIIEKKLTEKF